MCHLSSIDCQEVAIDCFLGRDWVSQTEQEKRQVRRNLRDLYEKLSQVRALEFLKGLLDHLVMILHQLLPRTRRNTLPVGTMRKYPISSRRPMRFCTHCTHRPSSSNPSYKHCTIHQVLGQVRGTQEAMEDAKMFKVLKSTKFPMFLTTECLLQTKTDLNACCKLKQT